jgi:hypothetical protein
VNRIVKLCAGWGVCALGRVPAGLFVMTPRWAAVA